MLSSYRVPNHAYFPFLGQSTATSGECVKPDLRSFTSLQSEICHKRKVQEPWRYVHCSLLISGIPYCVPNCHLILVTSTTIQKICNGKVAIHPGPHCRCASVHCICPIISDINNVSIYVITKSIEKTTP